MPSTKNAMFNALVDCWSVTGIDFVLSAKRMLLPAIAIDRHGHCWQVTDCFKKLALQAEASNHILYSQYVPDW